MTLSGAKDTTQSFTAITTGVARLDWWYRVTDSLTLPAGDGDFQLYLLPATGPVLSANSAGQPRMRTSMS